MWDIFLGSQPPLMTVWKKPYRENGEDGRTSATLLAIGTDALISQDFNMVSTSSKRDAGSDSK
jgi:hypothetical protein